MVKAKVKVLSGCCPHFMYNVPIIPVGLVYDAYYIFFDGHWILEPSLDEVISLAIVLTILIPVILLQYVALYRYAFKSPEIWE